MKKALALIMVLVLAVCCFAGCSGKKTEEKTDTPAASGLTLSALKEKGELVVATSPDFPPFESLENGKVVGIEFDVLDLVCKELGVTLKIEQMDFDSVLPGVQTGKYDCGASGITVTPDRQKNTLFTNPYCLAAQAIVVKDGSPIKTKADLEGKKITVQTSTTAEEYCMNNGYTNLMAFQANNDAQSALVTGKADAWVIDDLTAAEMVKQYNEKHDDKLVILDEAMTTEPYAFAFKLGSDEVANQINEVLAKLISDGTIKSIFDKYEAPYTAPETK